MNSRSPCAVRVGKPVEADALHVENNGGDFGVVAEADEFDMSEIPGPAVEVIERASLLAPKAMPIDANSSSACTTA